MNSSSALVRRPGAGFERGTTVLLQEGNPTQVVPVDPLMDFAIVRLGAGESIEETHAKESAWVLLRGAVKVRSGAVTESVVRNDLFDEPPTVLHVGPATRISIQARSAEVEFAVVRTSNDRRFSPRLFRPEQLTPEYRGSGLVQNACLRNVRLVFDRTARPDSNLVVGEVINYPGRWSSYPPHHHIQPEIYHYRFTLPSGYGHAELGDDVLKVRDGDTVLIPPGLDHAQVSAPGYGMYYLWMIRHLPGNPYTGFTFTPDHAWTLDATRQGWLPPSAPTSTP